MALLGFDFALPEAKCAVPCGEVSPRLLRLASVRSHTGVMAGAVPTTLGDDERASLRASSAALAATSLGAERTADWSSALADPSALGIDMTRAAWYRDALEWGAAFRSNLRGNKSSEAPFGLSGGSSVRVAESRADFLAVEWFVRSLAVYEKAPDDVAMDADAFLRDSAGSSPAVVVLIASLPEAEAAEALAEGGASLTDGAPAGQVDVAFAMYTTAYSSWRGRVIYLEDLFVVPSARRAGIGTELIRVGAAAAAAARCTRMVWVALNWNEMALSCYDKMGATRQDEWTTLHLDHGAVELNAIA